MTEEREPATGDAVTSLKIGDRVGLVGVSVNGKRFDHVALTRYETHVARLAQRRERMTRRDRRAFLRFARKLVRAEKIARATSDPGPLAWQWTNPEWNTP